MPRYRALIGHPQEVRIDQGTISLAGSNVGLTLTNNPPLGGPRVVYYTGTFDSGQANGTSSTTNGGRYACKFQPEGGVDTFFATTTGGGNGVTNSNLDQRVIASESFNGATITPRRGSHFLRQVIYFTKEYECLNNATSQNTQLDKPRTSWDLTNATYEHDFDREVWLGISIFTHPNHIHDIATRNHNGGNTNFTCSADTSFTQWNMVVFARPNSAWQNWSGGVGGNTEHWILIYQKRANAVADMNLSPNQYTHWVDLGDREDDRGLWTDFVVRSRLNPFTTSTNASSVGGKNHVYEGNKGILQIWKSTGPYLNANRDRAMQQVFSIFNAPVGGVPHASNPLQFRLGLYKYGWKKNSHTHEQPIYQGKDELRWGFRKGAQPGELILQSGSKDIDVNPSGAALPDWIEQT